MKLTEMELVSGIETLEATITDKLLCSLQCATLDVCVGDLVRSSRIPCHLSRQLSAQFRQLEGTCNDRNE